jgi:hypothetical protein
VQFDERQNAPESPLVRPAPSSERWASFVSISRPASAGPLLASTCPNPHSPSCLHTWLLPERTTQNSRSPVYFGDEVVPRRRCSFMCAYVLCDLAYIVNSHIRMAYWTCSEVCGVCGVHVAFPMLDKSSPRHMPEQGSQTSRSDLQACLDRTDPRH